MPTPRVSVMVAPRTGGATDVAAPLEQTQWDGFVRHHIVDVWTQATAVGLSHADAMDVCELVWRKAAQRLPALVQSGDARADLLTDVRREARRLQRLRSMDAARRSARPVVELDAVALGAAVGVPVPAGAGSTQASDGR